MIDCNFFLIFLTVEKCPKTYSILGEGSETTIIMNRVQCATKMCNEQWNLCIAMCKEIWILLPIMDWKPVSWSLLPIMDCLRSQIWMKFWKNPKKRPFANSKYTCNYISKTLPFIKGWFILDSVQTRWKFIFFHQAWEYLQPGKFSPVWQSRHGSKAEGDSAG